MEVFELGEKVLGSSLNALLEGFLLFFVELGCQRLDVFLNISDESLLVISWLLLYEQKRRELGSILAMLLNRTKIGTGQAIGKLTCSL